MAQKFVTANKSSNTAKQMLKEKPWHAAKSKQLKVDIDMELMRTAKSVSEIAKQMQKDDTVSSASVDDDENGLFVRSLNKRMRRFPPHEKALLRLKIEQLFYYLEASKQQSEYNSPNNSFYQYGGPNQHFSYLEHVMNAKPK